MVELSIDIQNPLGWLAFGAGLYFLVRFIKFSIGLVKEVVDG